MIDSLAPENLGGGERLAALIAMRLDPERWRSILCTTRPSHGDLHEEVRRSHAGLLELDRGGRLDLLSWRKLVSFLRRERVDVVHAHKFGSNLWGTLCGTITRVPVVVAHEHTWSYVGQPLRRLLDRHVVGRFADAFLAVSREDARRMVEIEHVRPEKVRFVPIGIPEPPSAGPRDVRAELGIPREAPLIGTVCALRPQKALDVLLRAAAELRSDHPGLHVVIGGDGPEMPRLRALAAELGLSAALSLPGFWPEPEVPALLAALDVAVNSSDFEGSPLAVMEFMAAGKPVVATAVGGTPDLLVDGVHGLLVPPRDPHALAAALRRLFADPELRRAMGERGRERQRREFTLDALVGRLEELYEELLTGARA
jgi:glycosyltransferase involved in cell wall biosynthesis